MSEPEDSRRQLLLKMYESLRREIDDFLKEIGVLVTSTILASATVWSWILVNRDKVGCGLLFVPAVLAFLTGMRAHALRQGTVRAADHLARLEQAFGVDEWLGWHIRWQTELPVSRLLSWSSLKPSLHANPLAPWLYVFWFSIVLLNLVPAVLLCVF